MFLKKAKEKMQYVDSDYLFVIRYKNAYFMIIIYEHFMI